MIHLVFPEMISQTKSKQTKHGILLFLTLNQVSWTQYHGYQYIPINQNYLNKSLFYGYNVDGILE